MNSILAAARGVRRSANSRRDLSMTASPSSLGVD